MKDVVSTNYVINEWSSSGAPLRLQRGSRVLDDVSSRRQVGGCQEDDPKQCQVKDPSFFSVGMVSTQGGKLEDVKRIV